MAKKLKIGQYVKLTAAGKKEFPEWGDAIGVVVRESKRITTAVSWPQVARTIYMLNEYIQPHDPISEDVELPDRSHYGAWS